MHYVDEHRSKPEELKISLWREDALVVLVILIAVLAAPLVVLVLERAAS
jgi:hypothetical protein